MAMKFRNPLTFIFVTLLSSLFVRYSSSFSPELPVKANDKRGFLPGLGTWYGDRHGAGSGGACGWGNDVQLPPFSSMIAAGNSRIFLHGKGCGDCYQIKCSRKPYCSGNPVTLTITDECPGGCDNVPFHFDLSGTAFGAMASPGQADSLRDLGQVDIQYRRVSCNYGRTKIAFKIEEKTNPDWFASAIEFVDGFGELSYVAIGQANSKHFVQMQNSWGAVWSANINPSFRGPFSFWLTSPTNKSILAQDVIPADFVAGKTYYSHVNFY